MNYELFYLVGASKESKLDKIKAEIAGIVAGEGGVFDEKQVVEKRKLAYPVKHENYGFYVAHRFDLEDAEKIAAINKKMNLYSNILRFIISKTTDLPELTSREERKEKSAKEARPMVKKETAPEEKKEEKKKETPKEPTAGEDKAQKEDIDKKLEEILNI